MGELARGDFAKPSASPEFRLGRSNLRGTRYIGVVVRATVILTPCDTIPDPLRRRADGARTRGFGNSDSGGIRG
jgi:hypothetical protein